MATTKTILSKLLCNQTVYKKTKKKYDEEILNLYEKEILKMTELMLKYT